MDEGLRILSSVNSDRFFNLDYRMGLQYIEKIIRKELDDRMWEKWLALLPHMNDKVSFDKFKEQHKPKTKKSKKINNDDFKRRIDNALKGVTK